MKLSRNVGPYILAGLIGVLASGYSIADDDAKGSGFIAPAVASKMTKVEVDDDHTAKRWVSPDLTGMKYKAVMIDAVTFYPAPDPSPQVSSSVLEQIAKHLTDALRSKIGAEVTVVDQAGPGVLRVQPAITAVVVKKEGLSPLDVLPVHLVFSAAKAATGNTDETVTAAIEVRITDSMTKDYLGAIALKLDSNTELDNNKDQLTLNDFAYSLDKGADRAATLFDGLLAQ